MARAAWVLIDDCSTESFYFLLDAILIRERPGRMARSRTEKVTLDAPKKDFSAHVSPPQCPFGALLAWDSCRKDCGGSENENSGQNMVPTGRE